MTICKQLLIIIYQNENHTNYNKNRASFTFAVRDAIYLFFCLSLIRLLKLINLLSLVEVITQLE